MGRKEESIQKIPKKRLFIVFLLRFAMIKIFRKARQTRSRTKRRKKWFLGTILEKGGLERVVFGRLFDNKVCAEKMIYLVLY